MKETREPMLSRFPALIIPIIFGAVALLLIATPVITFYLDRWWMKWTPR